MGNSFLPPCLYTEFTVLHEHGILMGPQCKEFLWDWKLVQDKHVKPTKCLHSKRPHISSEPALASNSEGRQQCFKKHENQDISSYPFLFMFFSYNFPVFLPEMMTEKEREKRSSLFLLISKPKAEDIVCVCVCVCQ
jgi:hypothetical protein